MALTADKTFYPTAKMAMDAPRGVSICLHLM